MIHLEVGQPATGAPASAVAAVRAALDRPLGYTNAPGLQPLRRRLAERYRELHGVEIDPARVLIVSGASAGFTLAFLAAFEPGARVAVIEPGYPCYRNTLIALGMEPVPIVVGPDTRWAPDAGAARGRRAPRRARRRLTVEPHRDRARRRRARAARSLLRRARHAPRRRRDLPRHHVRGAGTHDCSPRPIGRSSSTASRSTSR